MKKHFILVVLLAAVSGLAQAAKPEITVYKSAYCGCCKAWVAHLEQSGYTVKTIAMEDRTAIQQEAGIAPEEGSCHTAKVEGYALEGHVPAAAIDKLLAERPQIKGLTVPGMPANSPGMGPSNGTLRTLELGTHRTYSVN